MSISGRALSAVIGSTTIGGVHEWSAEETAEKLDSTTAANSGYATADFGVLELAVTLTLYLDVTTGAYSIVRRGTTITNLKLFLDKDATNPAFLIPSFKVFESSIRGTVRDRVIVSVRGFSQGSYTSNEPN